MARGNYGVKKRQRDQDKARKKRDRADRRTRKREDGPGEVEVVSADDMTGPLASTDDVLRALSERASGGKGANPIPCRLFVGGLSWGTTAENLRTVFGKFGTVADAIVVTDRSTGQSRGFGFVTMESRKDATRVIQEMNDSDLDGRTIVVNVATER